MTGLRMWHCYRIAGIVFLSGIWSLTVKCRNKTLYILNHLAKKVCEITSEDKDGKWVMLDSWVESNVS